MRISVMSSRAKSYRGLVVSLSISILAVVLTTALPVPALGDHGPGDGQQKQHAGELVQTVRDATRRFREVNQAMAEGYQLMFGCVSGPDSGAMGLHYVNMDLVADGLLDPRRPEIVIYEPLPNGGRRLIGADFLVFADAWHANNTATPELGGQLMHLIESPNRYGLPAFYTLHVWAWKPNPTGAFVNWHSDVSCEQFAGPQD
jgi:hypothetical protein